MITVEVEYSTASRELSCSCGWADGGHTGSVRSDEDRAMREHLSRVHGLSTDTAGRLVRAA